MNGLLNVAKPVGMTSREVVDAVSRAAGVRRIGHTGTLDPLAEGVLVLCLGSATRLVQYVQRMTKTYRAEFLLGHRSETDDTEGEVEVVSGVHIPTLSELEAAARQWTGAVRQRPPAYSAIKVEGQRAYRLARAGKEVAIPERTVQIDAIRILEYEPPTLNLEVVCHAGTYIRSLGRDLAESVGTTAVMASLVRTAVGPFCLDDAIRLEDLADTEAVRSHLLPMKAALAEVPHVRASDEVVARLANGQSVSLEELHGGNECRSAEELAVLDEAGTLRAILVRRGRRWGPKRVFR